MSRFQRGQYPLQQSSRMKGLIFQDPNSVIDDNLSQSPTRDRSNSLDNSFNRRLSNVGVNDGQLPAGMPRIQQNLDLNTSLPLTPNPKPIAASPSLAPIRRSVPKFDSQAAQQAPQNLNRNLPGALSQDRLDKFSSGGPTVAPLADKALLHDLDQKFDNQDRMINFILAQVQALESSNSQSANIVKNNVDLDRESIIKLTTRLQAVTDQYNTQQANLSDRLVAMESQVSQEAATRSELQKKLQQSEQTNLELANFLKSLSSQSETELGQMRNLLQKQLSEDYLNQAKNKEKNAVLLSEVVRISQQAEKQQGTLDGVGALIDGKIKEMEQRLSGAEQSYNLVNRKGDAASQFLNDVYQKMEAKVLSLEQQLSLLKVDQSKEKENLGRVEINSLKNSEDFRTMLGQLNSETSQKIEVRVTDLVNRLLTEQDERSRQLEDVKYQMDMKDKLSQEKGRHQAEELRDRYNQMDAIVRAEFQRKDQAIQSLQASNEAQFRGINGWIKQEEMARAQQETVLRTEIAKMGDAVRYEIDGFKSEQVQITDKISEMIKTEVDQRLTSDKDTKLLVQNLLKNVMTEVSQVKDQQEATVLKILKDVKDQAQDSAERAHFLSRYIDEEIGKIGSKTSKQVENLKVLCAKLTEQFKKHLVNHESMKKDLYKRFEIIESHLPVYRSELHKLMETTESRVLVKVNELKESMSGTIVQNFTALDDRVDQFSELVDQNLETLRKAIADNREVFVSIINKNVEESRGQNDHVVQDLERVIDEVFKVQVKAEQSEKKLLEDSFKLQKSVTDLEAHINTSIITEKSVRKAQDKQLAEELDQLKVLFKQIK